MKSRYPPFVSLGISNERLTILFNFPVQHTGDLAPYGIMTIFEMDPELVSSNYTTKIICKSENLTFMSRNSPCVLDGGRIYLHGAFPEFNQKPHVFRTEYLLGWVPGFPQVEPSMQALSGEMGTLDHWLLAGEFEVNTIQ